MEICILLFCIFICAVLYTYILELCFRYEMYFLKISTINCNLAWFDFRRNWKFFINSLVLDQYQLRINNFFKILFGSPMLARPWSLTLWVMGLVNQTQIKKLEIRLQFEKSSILAKKLERVGKMMSIWTISEGGTTHWFKKSSFVIFLFPSRNWGENSQFS